MSFRGLVASFATLLVAGSVACADVQGAADGLRAGAEDVAETTRFCLSLARAVAAVEAGSPATAAEAAEEVLVQAPDDVRDAARDVASLLREADDGERRLSDPELRAAVDRLHAVTRAACTPAGG